MSFERGLLLFLIGLAHFSVDTMLGIWPLYKSMVEIDLGKAGLIVAFGAMIGEGAQLFSGNLSDRGYRKVLILAGTLIAASSTFLPYASNDWVLFFLYFLTCVGSACFHPCAASLVSGLHPSRKNLVLAIFAACGSLGLATSQLTFTQAYEWFQGHTAWMILPGVALVFILMYVPFPRPSPIQSPRVNSFSIKELISFFKSPSLRFLYFSQVANQSILWGTIFILPDALKTLGHEDWICYGGGHCCFILGAACLMIPGGVLADYYSPRKVMIYGCILSCVTFYAILFSNFHPLVLLPSLFIAGATMALMNPLALSLGTRLEPQRTGAVSAFLMGMVWCVSEAIGPGGVGLMTHLFDDHASIKALAILGSLFILQLYATLKLPKEVIPLSQKA